MAKMFFGDSVPNEIIEQMREFNENIQRGNHTLENLPTDEVLTKLYKPRVTLREVVENSISLFS